MWSGPRPSIEEVVRRTPFPLYGLAPDWTGPRAAVSWHDADGEITRVALGHGATGRPGDPTLVVETLFGAEGEPGPAPSRAALHLDDDPPADERLWRPCPLVVDGREQVFWLGEVGERWAAFARVDAVRVVIAATQWDRADVRLAVVDRADYGPAASGVSTTSR